MDDYAGVTDVRGDLLNVLLSELCKPANNHVSDFVTSESKFSRQRVIASAVAASQDASTKRTNPAANGPQIVTNGNNVRLVQPLLAKLKRGKYESLLDSSDYEFETIFRMNRTSINKLICVVERRLKNKPTAGTGVPAAKKVMLTVWLMGNNSSFKKASVVFELAKATVYKIFHEVCKILTVLAGKYVRWPTPDDCSDIVNSFYSSYNFPGVIGVIGYCHIKIREPDNIVEAQKFLKEDEKCHTVILQAVIDNRLLFRDVCAGFPGCTPITHVLVGSPLYKQLADETNPLIQENEHLLGSIEYPQLSNLLTPFTFDTNNRSINKQEEEFNSLHQLACQVADFSFTVLKERFPRLNYLDVCRPELASKVIVAACVLHNFTILENNEWFYIPDNSNSTGDASVM